MRRWGDLTQEELEEYFAQVHLQNLLDDVVDLDYQAYYMKMTKEEIENKLWEKIENKK